MAERADSEPGPFADLDDYDMRHLAAHLVASRRLDDLHAMLTLDHTGRNAWYQAKRSAGDLAGYIADLQRADAAAVKAGQFARRIGYTVMRASTQAGSSSLPVMVQRRLVDTQTWGSPEVIASVTAQASPYGMARALAILGDGLSDAAERTRIEELIVDKVRRTADRVIAAKALCQLAATKGSPANADLIEMALDVAQRIPPGQDRYAVLATIAGKQLGAPETIVCRAIAGMLALLGDRDEHSQARSLGKFAYDVAPSGRQLIARHLAGLTEPTARSHVLRHLLATDPTSEVMTAARDCLHQLDDPGDQLSLAAALAARMPPASAQHMLGNVWSKARVILTPDAVPDVVDAIGAAEGSLRDDMLAAAIDLADQVHQGTERLSSYAAIVAMADETARTHINDRIIDELLFSQPRLPGTAPLDGMPERFGAVVALAREDRDAYAWCVNLALDWCVQLGVEPGDFGEVALHHVASFVQGDDISRVLDIALRMPNTGFAAAALREIAPRLTSAQHLVAIDRVRQFDDPLPRDEALVALVKAVPDELFDRTALGTIAAIASYDRRRAMINELVWRADPDALPAWVALASTDDHVEPIARLKLSLLRACHAATQQAVADPILDIVRGYAQLPPAAEHYLTVDKTFKKQRWSRSNEIGEAAAMAERHRWWLAALSAPRNEFPSQLRGEMLSLAREFAVGVRDQAEQAVAQARIALAAGDQQLLDKALQAARSRAPGPAAVALAKIAGLLPAAQADPLIREATEILGSLPETSPLTKTREAADFFRNPTQEDSADLAVARMIAACPHHLPDGMINSAADRVPHIEDWGVRAELLAALSCAAEPTLAAQFHRQAEAHIGLISGWIDELTATGFTEIPQEITKTKRQLIMTLVAVASTTAEFDEQLLDRLVSAANEEESSSVVADLLDQLPARCRDRTHAPTALALVRGISNAVVRRWALGYLASSPAADLGGISATLDALASRPRSELLGDLGCLGPLLAPTCTADDAEELINTLDCVARWWP